MNDESHREVRVRPLQSYFNAIPASLACLPCIIFIGALGCIDYTWACYFQTILFQLIAQVLIICLHLRFSSASWAVGLRIHCQWLDSIFDLVKYEDWREPPERLECVHSPLSAAMSTTVTLISCFLRLSLCVSARSLHSARYLTGQSGERARAMRRAFLVQATLSLPRLDRYLLLYGLVGRRRRARVCDRSMDHWFVFVSYMPCSSHRDRTGEWDEIYGVVARR